MQRFLAYALQATGHVAPFIPILLELRARGYEVSLALNGRGNSPDQISGIPTTVAHAATSAEGPSPSPRDGGVSVRSGSTSPFVRNGKAAADVLEWLIERERPDLLVVDPLLWGGMVVAEASGLPWASVAHNPVFFRGTGLDVRGPGLPPPRTLLGRFCHRLIERRTRDRLPIINRLRAEYGLTPLRRPSERYLRPPLTIATTAEPFEYPRDDWPSSLRFTGPITWDSPDAPEIETPDGPEPLILVVGSTILDESAETNWGSVVLAGLADERVRVVAGLPSGLPDRLPPNVTAARFIPVGRLLHRAACVVCQGSSGTVSRAMAAGVPVVAIPNGFDRFEVARRLETAQAGVILLPKDLTPERLRFAVRKAMGLKAGSMRVASAFRKLGGAVAAADAIEELYRLAVPLGDSVGPDHDRR